MKKQQRKSAPEDAGFVVIEDELLAEGFIILPKVVLHHKGLSAGAKVVYSGLLSYAWRDGGPGPRRRRASVFPGQARLASDLGLSRSSVVRHLKELAKKGFVLVTRQGLGRTNIYRLPPLTAVCQIDTSGSRNLTEPEGANCDFPSFEEDEVEEDEVSLSLLLATTMGHQRPPARIERACRDTVKELLDAGEEAATLRRAIHLLPGQGDVYGPGFLVARWGLLKAELAAQDEAAGRAAAQRVVAPAEEKKQATADAAWAAIEALPAEQIRALRERARQSQLSVLAEVRDEHPVLRAGMVALWQKRGGLWGVAAL